MPDQVILAFFHLLVFVYWLGGDLGAFYASHALTAPAVPADRRLFAARIVADVDMAPRSALILALPTGFLLADARGWIDAPPLAGAAILGASLVWLAVIWRLHRGHGAQGGLKRLDLFFRVAALSGLGAAGAAGIAGALAMPFFIAAKCLLLAGAIAMGLVIRRALAPLAPALAGLSGPEGAKAEAQTAGVLRKARLMVVVIWLLIGAAALFGLATPP